MKFTAWIERDGKPRQYEFLCYNPQASLLAWHGGNQLWIEPDRIRMTKLGCLEMIRERLKREANKAIHRLSGSTIAMCQERIRCEELRTK